MTETTETAEAEAAGMLCGDDVDVGGLGDGELVERARRLGWLRSRLDAELASTVAEIGRRDGGRVAAATMRHQLRVSARQATAEVALAESLCGLAATFESWRAGEITAGYARVIARVAADPDHCDEAALLGMARDHPVDLFARMTRRYMKPAVAAEERRRQWENRWASLVQDPDGSWRLSAYFDCDDGKRVSLSFNAMVRSYKCGPPIYGSKQAPTGANRRADALAELITGEGPNERPKATLLVIADYDAVARQLRDLRYDDGLPVAADRIAGLAAQAKIVPAFFDADGDPLWLGKARRGASPGQRIVLAARDGGCVNCAKPAEACDPHHVRWHSRGGPTDIDNLCLLCEGCHHLVHDDGWQLHRSNRRHATRPPDRPGRTPATAAGSQRNPILRT